MGDSNKRDMNRLVAETVEAERREFEAGRKWPSKLSAPAPPDARRLEAALIDEAYHLEHAGDGRLLKKLFRGLYLCDLRPGDSGKDRFNKVYRQVGSHWELDPVCWREVFMLSLGEAYNGRARDFFTERDEWRAQWEALFPSKKDLEARIKSVQAEARRLKKEAEGLAELEFELRAAEARLLEISQARAAAEKTGKAFEARARRCLAIPRMLHAADAAFSGEDGLLLPRGLDFNEHPTWLPALNGTIDLANGRLMESRADHYFNMAVEWEYRGLDEPCPNWMETVAKIFGRDAEMIEYVEHVIGSALTGFSPKHLIIALGPMANNGKSLFFGTIARCLGPFAREIDVDLLLKQNNK